MCTNLRNVASQVWNNVLPFARSKRWTIEDEQCQRVGAVTFRFLLFL